MGIRTLLHETSRSVMEHEYSSKNDTEMLLKQGSIDHTLIGSPRISNDGPLKDSSTISLNVVSQQRANGGHNGVKQQDVPSASTSAQLHVQINGFSKSSSDSSPLEPDSNSNQSAAGNSAQYSMPNSSRRSPDSIDSPLTTGPSSDTLGFPSDAAIQDAMRLVNPLASPHATREKLPLLEPQPSSSGVSVSTPVSVIATPAPTPFPRGQTAEVKKRRTLTEKITQLREKGTMKYIVPQCEQVTPTQLGIQLRRFYKKQGQSRLSPAIQKKVFEEEDVTDNRARSRVQFPAPSEKRLYDPNETDVSDVELDDEEMSVHCLPYYLFERPSLMAQDSRALLYLEEKLSELCRLNHYTPPGGAFEFTQASFEEQESGETCAKIRPWVNKSLRRTVYKKTEPVREPIDYSAMQPSTSNAARYSSFEGRISPSLNSAQEDIPIPRRIQAYLHEISCIPAGIRRKKVDQSPWLNLNDVEEEHRRNGRRKPEAAERARRAPRANRILETLPSEEEFSSDEDYRSIRSGEDSDEDEYEPRKERDKTSNRNREIHSDKRKRSRRKRPLYEGRETPAAHFSKIGRRHTVSSLQKRVGFAIDDVVMDYGADFGLSGLPQKVEYKEIFIPRFRKVDDELLGSNMSTEGEGDDLAHRTHIAMLHQELLVKERKLVTSKRQKEKEKERDNSIASSAASKSRSSSPPPEPAVIAQSINEAPLKPEILFSPPSSVPPYPPRKFIR